MGKFTIILIILSVWLYQTQFKNYFSSNTSGFDIMEVFGAALFGAIAGGIGIFLDSRSK